jgi:flagellar hook protein FlgE
LQSGGGEYNSGAVNTTIRYAVSQQGTPKATSSNTDMMIQGNGFFVVESTGGQTMLTRAGSFTVDASSGNLVNAAGYTAMGYDIRGGQDPSVVLNGTGGLVPINLQNVTLAAIPTTTGTFSANLPLDTTVVAAANLPSANAASAAFSQKSSISTYDNLGNEVILDIYLTKTAGAAAGPPATTGTWEMAIYNKADAASATAPFPYSSAALSTQTMTFDSTGQLATGTGVDFTIPGGMPLTFDTSKMTQLNNGYTPEAIVNGSAPSAASDFKVSTDGTVYAIDSEGNTTNLFKIPLATVASPDKLTPVVGNAYQVNLESGALQIGFAGNPGYGSVTSNALENSNVDMASELTEMIIAQRDYTANSKVFQTGAEMLDVLMNLKR